MNKVLLVVVSTLIAVVLIFSIGMTVFFRYTPTGVTLWNNWFHDVNKADDNTSYENRKKVEETCRSMIASYNADKLVYEQYRGANSEEKLSWAEQAKMRANKTAATYNEYIIKNSYVWKDNVPDDIYMELEVITSYDNGQR